MGLIRSSRQAREQGLGKFSSLPHGPILFGPQRVATNRAQPTVERRRTRPHGTGTAKRSDEDRLLFTGWASDLRLFDGHKEIHRK